uniref:FTO alpha-ketoglutarate dependent dioxygenase n=1 Tax=Sinocyclocheilus rhinocerous TaxID=307959 RepID=A0A673JFY5_9TELE
HSLNDTLAGQSEWDSSYAGLALRQSSALPDGLHERVQSALITLQRCGCLLRDLVRVRDRDVFTAVSRALVGQPGYTYRYLNTRLFTIPWHCEGEEGQKDEKEKPCCDSDLRDQEKEKKEEEEEDSGQGCSHSSPPSSTPPPDVAGLVQFNMTLINYMDPTAMTQLKEEPYYGMGKMAVGWHHDENLVPLSPVAVYSYSCPAEPKNEVATKTILFFFFVLHKCEMHYSNFHFWVNCPFKHSHSCFILIEETTNPLFF